MTIRRHSKSVLKTGSSFAALSLALALSGHAYAGALPGHGHFVSGQGSIAKGNQSVTVKQSTTTGIINWNSFSVGQKNSVTFDNGRGATLNRVTGGNLSTIAGSLRATGSLYLMNNAGVIVSGTGHIVTGGNFAASGGNIANAAFGDGDRRFKPGTGNVVNRGSIVAGGSASLAGRNVSDTGTIHASAVNLSAANGLAIGGAIAASKAGGTGGAVTARAQTIVIGTNGVIDASSTESGQKGGTISVVARGTTTVAGTLKAEGGRNGAGGFIETSGGHLHVADSARISTLAANGKAGTWLIDPHDFTIAASGGDITGAMLSHQLANGNVDIKSSAGAHAGSGEIFVEDSVAWSSTHTLTLDAYQNIYVEAPIRINGGGGLVLIDGDTSGTGVNDGVPGDGDYYIDNGSIAFPDVIGGHVQGSLTIDGASYKLVENLDQLASAIAGNAGGDYALANSIKAGTAYTASPITTGFSGTFTGLGNTISNLTIKDKRASDDVGLFAQLGGGGTIRDIGLVNANVTGTGASAVVGGLVGDAGGGTISGVSVSGTVTATGQYSDLGGVVGSANSLDVENSTSSAAVKGGDSSEFGGGFIGFSSSSTFVDDSASGPVTVGSSVNAAGGFAGALQTNSTVQDSHATGAVTAGPSANLVGGFVAYVDDSTVETSFATGNVSVGSNSGAGGFVGLVDAGSTVETSYATGFVRTNGGGNIGGFAGENRAVVTQSYSTGLVSGGDSPATAGGFIGYNTGTISQSYATGDVSGGANALTGGFVGEAGSGAITNSWASGMIVNAGDNGAAAGGFAGLGSGTLSYDYATGDVFVGANASGEEYTAGGFAGLTGATIDHSWASGNVQEVGTVNNDTIEIGGFAGRTQGGSIADSFATGDVASAVVHGGAMYEGGFIGLNNQGTPISDGYATGTVTGASTSGGSMYGGFVGFNRGPIAKSYETGAVNVAGLSGSYVGGFAGYQDAPSSVGTIDESYSFGTVTAAAGDVAGGFIGDNNKNSGVAASIGDYYNKTANPHGAVGQNADASDTSVAGLSATAMFKKSSYAGWSFGTSTSGAGWVLADTDGTFNNKSGAAGGTLPMLESEYSTTITNAHALQLVGLDLSADYTLGNTIDASGTAGGDVWGAHGFDHIGTFSGQYSGTFDGQGYAIVDLTQQDTPDSLGGVFASLNFGAEIENLGLVNVSIDNSMVGGGSDGAIVAGFSSGTLFNDYTTGKVMAGASGYSGGLAGANDGQISHSWSSASVSGTGGTAVGGLAGVNNGGITTSYATGNVAVTVGGSSYAGGLVGLNNGGTIDTSYASGTVTGASGTAVGAFAGRNTGSIGISYFDKTTNGSTPGVGSGSSTGVVGRTATQMMSASTFKHWTFGGLNSGADWVIVDDDSSLDNAGGSTGGTMPMLLGEYSTTISNAHQLQLIEIDPLATYFVATDIDAGGTAGGDVWGAQGFIAIGGNNNPLDGFSGIFAGGGHTVSGLAIDDTTNADVGLFGVIDPTGQVSGITLANAAIHSTASVGTGGLVGENLGTIVGVTVGGTVTGSGATTGTASVGGIAGLNDGFIGSAQSSATVIATHDGLGAAAGGLVGMANPDSVIEDSFATGAVSMRGDDVAAGGLVGLNGGSISQSFAGGAVTVTDPQSISANSAGGLVGSNDKGTIADSYALGNVSASGGASALTGGFAGANSGTISDSFSLGSATGGFTGGFVGFEDHGQIAHSYWDTQTSGLLAGAGMVSGANPSSLAARTTAQLEAALPSTFDGATWGIVAGTSLPYLNWQFISGTPQVVSGTVLNGVGGATVANSTVSLLEDGANLDSVLTGGSVVTYANGFYYFLLSPDSIGAAPSAGLIAYDTDLGAAVFADQALDSTAGLDLTAGYFRETTSQGALSAMNADFTQALNGNSAVGTFIEGLADLEIDSAASFDIDQAIHRTGTVIIDAGSGGVNQTSAIAASRLLLEGGANYTLDAAGNSFSTLAMSGPGSLDVTDNVALTIGKVAGVAGVNAGGGVVLETRHGGIKITQLIKAASHPVTLASAGSIVERGAGAIRASSLSGSSKGAADLNGANVIADLGDFTTGGRSFALTNAGALTVDGAIDTGNGTLAFTTTKGGIVIDGALNVSTATLDAASMITESASAMIDATTLTGSSAGAASFVGTNTIANLGAFTTNGDGSFRLDDSSALIVIGGVKTGADNIVITTGGDLTIRRQIKNTGTVSLVSGGSIGEGANGKIVTGKLNVTAQTGIVLEGDNQIQKLGTDRTASGPNKIKGVD